MSESKKNSSKGEGNSQYGTCWITNEIESKKGEAETLAGFLLEISGNFPKKRQKITFHNLIFTIENVDKRRIKQIKVTLL